jgi:hypothetical protein
MYSPSVSPHPTTTQKSSTFGSLVGRHIGDTYVLISKSLSNFTKAMSFSKEGIEANNQVRNISKIIRFPTRFIMLKDIALVKFDKLLEINTYVSPICLPTREPNVDDFCVVVGWGATLGV